MADAGTHRITNLCRFCGKAASLKKTSARPKGKFKLEFERHGVNVEDDNDFIHPPNVCLTCVGYFYHLRWSPSSHALGKIPISNCRNGRQGMGHGHRGKLSYLQFIWRVHRGRVASCFDTVIFIS